MKFCNCLIFVLSVFVDLSAKTAPGIPYIISGPSAAGKTTLISMAVKKFHGSCDLSYPLMYTTRPMRSGEINGFEYYFVTKEEFAEKLNNQEFFYTLEYDHFAYGYSASEMDDLANGKSYFIVIDFDSAKIFKKLFPFGVFIWIDVADVGTLEQRLRTRYLPDFDKFLSRYNLAIEERFKENQENLFDYHILNDDFNEAIDQLCHIIHTSQMECERQL